MERMRLIKAGAQGVNIATASGRTAMIVAAAFGYAQLLKKLLLANRDDPGVPTTATPWTSPLLVACDAGHATIPLGLSVPAGVRCRGVRPYDTLSLSRPDSEQGPPAGPFEGTSKR